MQNFTNKTKMELVQLRQGQVARPPAESPPQELHTTDPLMRPWKTLGRLALMVAQTSPAPTSNMDQERHVGLRS